MPFCSSGLASDMSIEVFNIQYFRAIVHTYKHKLVHISRALYNTLNYVLVISSINMYSIVRTYSLFTFELIVSHVKHCE